jgi:hypothetical protein
MEASFSSVALLPVEWMAAMTWLRFAFVKTSGIVTAWGVRIATPLHGEDKRRGHPFNGKERLGKCVGLG